MNSPKHTLLIGLVQNKGLDLNDTACSPVQRRDNVRIRSYLEGGSTDTITTMNPESPDSAGEHINVCFICCSVVLFDLINEYYIGEL
jgi:hypothetical protein